MSGSLAKRFYKAAATAPADGGVNITLDGRPVRTPGGQVLALSPALADAVAREWGDQGDDIVPDTMPVMQLACTAIDRVAPRRHEIVADVAGYGASEFLCYWAEGPEPLVNRQAETWKPYLDWAEAAYGARLAVTAGIVHLEQDPAALEALAAAVAAHDDFELTGLAQLVQISGSLVLGLAVSAGHAGWQEAFDASQLDETWQAEGWGEDFEAAERRRNLARDMESAARFLALARA